VQVTRLPVADGDDEVGSDEHEHLAELDHLGGVDIARGLQHQEDHLVVDLELRTLVCMDGVLYRERVQVELASERVELLLGRLVEPDPHELARVVALVVRVAELDLAVAPLAVLVDRAVDDH
jgi:hypothetical protein